jgi:putative endonuclease
MEDKFFVYALVSAKDKRIYVGFSRDIDKRIYEHNSGKTKSTKGFRPWTLLYFEEVEGRDSARQREKYYKSGIGKEFLKSLIT